jgi:DnaK suppressor protein
VARKTTGKTSSKSRSSGKAASPRQAIKVSKSARSKGEKHIENRAGKVGRVQPMASASRGEAKSKAAASIAAAQPGRNRPNDAQAKVGKGKAETKADLKGKKGRSVAEAASEIVADSKGYVFINGRRVRMISPKAAKPGKKVRSDGAGSLNTAAEESPPIKSIKTKLDRKELNYYRDLLLMKRRELIGDLNSMETEALRSGSGNLSHMPIHMADIGTDTNDQDLMLGLAETERRQLREIDGALQRIEDRTFGVCQLTGESIPKTRLEAKPWAKYTVEAARILEGQGAA